MTEYLFYRRWLNTYYTGVDWTLIIQELTAHLLYRSWLNTYYTGDDWILIIQEMTECLCRSRLNTYYTGVDWTLIIQEMTEYLCRSRLNTYYTGVDWTLIIQEMTEYLCRSRLNTYYTGVDWTLIIQGLTEPQMKYKQMRNSRVFLSSHAICHASSVRVTCGKRLARLQSLKSARGRQFKWPLMREWKLWESNKKMWPHGGQAFQSSIQFVTDRVFKHVWHLKVRGEDLLRA